MKRIRTLIFGAILVGCLTAVTSPAYALIAAHYNYNACNTCHQLHNGPSQVGGLLSDVDSESTCLGCHGPLGIATEVAIHDPNSHGSGNLGYITCLECHNPHGNGNPAEPTAPNPRPNADGGFNVKMIGMEFDYNDTDGSRSRLLVPQVREESALVLGALKDIIFEASPADWGRVDVRGLCNACHGATHNVGENCAGCHAHNDNFKGKGCTGCHDGLGAGALSISAASPHSETITGYSCEDCHTGHSAGTIEIPNNTTVGINYGSNGEDGIALGSTVATGSTEAEICWNCHDANGVSEWGTNTQVSTGSSPYDYGSVNSGAGVGWYADTTLGGEVGSTWFSANFGYKSGAIQSTHSADGTATTPGLDPVDTIRCSYCHDVHDLNTLVSDNNSGKPYLRGTWMGNPYLEDGAPFSGQTYASQGNFGAVPRGGTGATEMGGFQIDQNNGSPTSTWTLTDSAGLCTICHGFDVDAMNEFSVDEVGAAETPAQSWVGTNGHSNAVLGGTGSAAVNIFREDWRKPNDGYCPPGSGTDVDGNAGNNGDSYCAGYPNMANQQFISGSLTWGGSLRGAASLGAQGFWVEPQIGGNQPFAYDDYNWGASVDVASTDTQYHQFSCSKCHNPHASRLPRLMTTNCLDVSHNTWGDAPVTMSKEDIIRPVTITSDCGQGGTFNIEFIDINNDLLYLPQSAFSASCTRADYTITWDGVDYNYARSDLVSNVTINIRGTDYTFDSAEVSAINAQSWIGKGVPSTFSLNDAGKSRISDDNSGVKITYATSAQNCHRYVDWNDNGDTSDAGDQKGWNNVTPW